MFPISSMDFPATRWPSEFDLLDAIEIGRYEIVSEYLDRIECLSPDLGSMAIEVAAKKGSEKLVSLLLRKGASPSRESLSLAISNGSSLVAQSLLEAGVPSDGALNHYLRNRIYGSEDLELLNTLLLHIPRRHDLTDDAIFQIGAYLTAKECDLMVRLGFCSSLSYLLYVAVLYSEMSGVDATLKINSLILRCADPRFFKDPYFHVLSNPALIKRFKTDFEMDIHAKSSILEGKEFAPIELSYTEEAVEAFVALGANRELSPFLKGTRAHREALERIGYDPSKGLDQLTSEGEVPILKAVFEKDIKAFIALLSEGVNINWQNEATGWSVLHYLFASLPAPLEFDMIMNNMTVRLIHIAIKCGALPYTDRINRSPLMCLSNEHPLEMNPLIDLYIQFEAKASGISAKVYQQNFLNLRAMGLPTAEGSSDDLSLRWAIPGFTDFWRSFK